MEQRTYTYVRHLSLSHQLSVDVTQKTRLPKAFPRLRKQISDLYLTNHYHSVRLSAKYMNCGHTIARTRQTFFTISTNKRTQLSINSQQYYTTHYCGLNNNSVHLWAEIVESEL
jgi:hypothetical protein